MTSETELRIALEDANLRYHEYAQAKEMWENQKALAEYFEMPGDLSVKRLYEVYIDKFNAYRQANNRVMDLKCETPSTNGF
jgi:hypothetical protein